MTKKMTTGLLAQWMPAAAALMLFLALATSCAQTPKTSNSQPQQQATPQAQRTPPPRPAKVVLNAEDMGTTADLSGLDKLLTKVMKDREEQRVFKPGTDEVEKTVFVRAQPSLKLGEVLKVLQVVREAGASPVKLPVKVKDGDRNPAILTLAVTVGEVESEPRDFLDGLPVRYFQGTAVDRAEKDYMRETHITVEMRKDGEYLVNEKPVAKSALSGELQSLLKNKDKSIIALVEKDPQISYLSLAELAQAAFDAQAEGLQVHTLAP
jgi:biopolymer transport protein ExbD